MLSSIIRNNCELLRAPQPPFHSYHQQVKLTESKRLSSDHDKLLDKIPKV